MIDCEQFLENIDKYLDHDLPETDMAQMEAHLRHCEACAQELRFAESIRQSLNNLPPITVPEDFKAKLYEKIEQEKQAPVKKPFYLTWKPYSALAACLLLFALVKVNIWDETDTLIAPTPEPSAAVEIIKQQHAQDNYADTDAQDVQPTPKAEDVQSAVKGKDTRIPQNTKKPVPAVHNKSTESEQNTSKPKNNTAVQTPNTQPQTKPENPVPTQTPVADKKEERELPNTSDNDKKAVPPTEKSQQENTPIQGANASGEKAAMSMSAFDMEGMRILNVRASDEDKLMQILQDSGITAEKGIYRGTAEQVKQMLIKLEQNSISYAGDIDEETTQFEISWLAE